MQAVEVVYIAHPAHHGSVTVGDERQRGFLFLLRPEVVVLHHHKHVASAELFFTAQHHVAYALVVDVGSLVAACHHHGFVVSHLRVACGELLYEIVARHHLYVGKARKGDFRELSHLVMGYHLPYNGGVVEYAGQRTLAQHLAEVCLKHVKTVAPHKVGTQRWRLLLSHWRQLGGVADEHKAAVAPVVDILCKVVEQASAAKNRLCEAVVGYHRRLVHDEECVGMEVVVKAERAFKRFLTIYLAMYGVRRAASIERQHFCGAACRSQQHHLASH